FFPIGAFYPSQIGGPCNTLYWHTRELASHALEVNIVTTTLGIEEGRVKPDQIIRNENWQVYYGRGNYNSIKIAQKGIKESKNADIIHFNSFFDLLSISCFFYNQFFSKKKFVWSARGQLSTEALKFSKLKKRPLIFLYKLFSKNVLFHATSPEEAADIRKAFGTNKIIQVPNFIELTEQLYLPTK